MSLAKYSISVAMRAIIRGDTSLWINCPVRIVRSAQQKEKYFTGYASIQLDDFRSIDWEVLVAYFVDVVADLVRQLLELYTEDDSEQYKFIVNPLKWHLSADNFLAHTAQWKDAARIVIRKFSVSDVFQNFNNPCSIAKRLFEKHETDWIDTDSHQQIFVSSNYLEDSQYFLHHCFNETDLDSFNSQPCLLRIVDIILISVQAQNEDSRAFFGRGNKYVQHVQLSRLKKEGNDTERITESIQFSASNPSITDFCECNNITTKQLYKHYQQSQIELRSSK